MTDISLVLPSFDLRQLRSFVAVAEELHFGRAAVRLGIAQPPLSQQIRRLEERLGVPLFVRTRRSVELTPVGELLLEGARPLLAHARELEDTIRNAEDMEGGTVRLGFVGSAAYDVVPTLVRRARVDLPGLSVIAVELPTTRQLAALRRGSLDAGIVRLPVEDEATLERLPLTSDPTVAAVPDTHPLAGRARIALAELAGEPFIIWSRRNNPRAHDDVIEACRDAGFAPRVVQEPGEIDTMLSLVAAGLGVALVPGSMRRIRPNGVRYPSLEGRPIPISLALMWNTQRAGPAVRHLVETARGVEDWTLGADSDR